MRTILKAPRLIDGTGGPVKQNAALVMDEGKIKAIVSQDQLTVADQASARVIEVENGTILPGFIEMHTHLTGSGGLDVFSEMLSYGDERLLLQAVRNARICLETGVTTVRDCGSKNHLIFSLRKAINEGILTGPRIVASGDVITTTGGHGYYFGLEADNADEVRQAARRQAKAGADFFKIMATGGNMTPGTNIRRAQYSVQEIRAAVEEGRRLNRRVAAHCHATEGIRNAVESGVTTIEHCSWVGEDGSLVYDAHVVETILEKGIHISPTNSQRYRLLQRLKAAEDTARWKRLYDERQRRNECWRDMLKKGVPFVVSSDAGASDHLFDDYALNFELMVKELGMSPMQALLCGTKVAAEALGLASEIGTLEPAKAADAVVVAGDPLSDIIATYQVQVVVKAGQVVKGG